MAVLPVVKFPDKVLKTRATEVTHITTEDRKLVKRKRLSDGRSYVVIDATSKGERLLAKAVTMRLRELKSAGPVLAKALSRLTRGKPAASPTRRKKPR